MVLNRIRAPMRPASTSAIENLLLGLRIRKGCSFHGLALNIAMDLSPFLRINPCGYAGMEMTQMRQWQPDARTEMVSPRLAANLLALLNDPPAEYSAA
jgi:lipoyl(octanoyl) transferase